MIRFLFLLFFATLPFQFALSPLPGIDLHISRLFALGLFGLWLIRSFIRQSLSIPTKPETWLLFAVFFLSAFSLFFVENASWGTRKLFFLLSFLPILLIASSLLRATPEREAFVRALTGGATLSALVGIVQFLLPFVIGLDPAIQFWQHAVIPLFSGLTFSNVVTEYSSMVVNIGGTNFLRASAFFPDPHIASFFWGMSLPLSIALAFQAKRDQEKKSRFFLFAATSLLILLADILTFSRGGYIALLATLFLSLAIRFSDLIRKHTLPLLLSGAVFVLALIIPTPLSERLVSSLDLSDHSTSGRLAIWNEAIHIIKQHPLTGVGLGNYSNTVLPSAQYREPRYAHNIFLDIAAETGVATAFIFFLAISLVLIQSLLQHRNRPFIFAGGCSILIFSVHSFFETPLYSVHILPLFLSLLAFIP